MTSSKEVQNLARQIPLDPKAGKESSSISYSAFQASNFLPPKSLQSSTSPKASSFQFVETKKVALTISESLLGSFFPLLKHPSNLRSLTVLVYFILSLTLFRGKVLFQFLLKLTVFCSYNPINLNLVVVQSHPWCSLQNMLSHFFCYMYRPKIFQMFKFWFIFAYQFLLQFISPFI